MIREPFCWLSMAGLQALEELPDRERKAAQLVYLALARLASARHDGEHSGFAASGSDVVAASGLHRNTVYAARDALVRLGLLTVEGTQGRQQSVWILRDVHNHCASSCTTTVQPRAGASDGGEEGEEMSLLTEAPADPVGIVFEHWRSVVPRKSGCRLTPERREKIKARLKTFSAEDLLRAIDVVAADPFSTGQNDRGKPFNDFKTIFRNDSKVEEWLEQADHGVVVPLRPDRSRGASVEDFARIALG